MGIWSVFAVDLNNGLCLNKKDSTLQKVVSTTYL